MPTRPMPAPQPASQPARASRGRGAHAARGALIFGALAVLPFVWGAATQLLPGLADFGLRFLGPRFLGPYVGLGYGAVLLATLSGVLLGFALRAEAGARLAVIAMIPAAWAFLFTGGGPVSASIWLGAGYLAALALDFSFWRNGVTPVWWLPLRVGQTAVILTCLLVTAFF